MHIRLGAFAVLLGCLAGAPAMAQAPTAVSATAPAASPPVMPAPPVGFKDLAKMPAGPKKRALDPSLIPATAQEQGHKHQPPVKMQMLSMTLPTLPKPGH